MKPVALPALLFFLLLLLVPSVVSAQHEYDLWCFGSNAGLKFGAGGAVPISARINALEGTASIADPVTGALLFYSDGDTVFNRDGIPMPSGTGLKGNSQSSQSALIVPVPGNASRYYLFTSDEGEYDSLPHNGVHYSIVDMSLDGGRGDVAVKAVPLLANAAEKLTAVRHRDGCSYWVLMHGWNDDAFHAYLVNESGLSAEPVISHVGSVHQDPPNTGIGFSSIGYMKASPDGRYLALATFSTGIAELFRFDDATGRVSDPLRLPIEGLGYGVSFSPDNSKLYLSCRPAILFQFDLSNPDPAVIIASRATLAYDPDRFTPHEFGALQIGPDGRIYLARVGDRYLGIIERPNAVAGECGYRAEGFDLGAGRLVWLGLPNHIDSYFNSGTLRCGAPSADFIPADPDICAGDCLAFTDRSTNDPTSWQWTFTGANPSVSSERNPSGICFDRPGTYQATLTATNAIGSAQITRTIVVRPRGDLRASIAPELVAAPGDTIAVPITLDAGTIPPDAGSLRLTFRYGPGMMRLLSLEEKGTLLDGWTIDSVADDPLLGTITARLTPPPGKGIQGGGTLLVLRFATALGWATSSTLQFDLSSTQMRCMNAVAAPGMVRLEFCGGEDRFIELIDGSYTLGAHPNPFNPSVRIDFSLGLDGPATLDVFDIAGRRIARLADGYLNAGEHSITWDASAFPSGTYYCRITSGGWSSMRELVLRR